MSDKRFKLQHINDLTDQEYMRLKKITDNGELITLGEVVDLLNEQQATIEQLRQSQDVKEFSALFNQSIALQREIKDLKEENEQLKEKLQSVTMLKDDYEELIESFEKKYGKNIEDVIDDE